MIWNVWHQGKLLGIVNESSEGAAMAAAEARYQDDGNGRRKRQLKVKPCATANERMRGDDP